MKYLFWLSILLLSVSCSVEQPEGTDNNTQQSSYGGISGIVSDRATGDPVSVVQLILQPSGKTTVTGSDGSYNF